MPRISALPPATRAAGEDELPIVDASEASTKKATVDLIMPTGSILDYAGTSAPSGWLLCYGQSLDASANPEYQALYDVIGNTYGGSSNTNFVVPDLRGRVVAGQDDMGGTSANRLTGATGSVDGDVLGGTGGLETTRHAFMETPMNSSNFQDPGNNYIGSVTSDIDSWLTGGSSSSVTHSVTVRNVGGTIGSNGTAGTEVRHARYTAPNIQPTIILNKIIKY